MSKNLLWLGDGPLGVQGVGAVKKRGDVLNNVPKDVLRDFLNDPTYSKLFIEMDDKALIAFNQGDLILNDQGQLQSKPRPVVIPKSIVPPISSKKDKTRGIPSHRVHVGGRK